MYFSLFLTVYFFSGVLSVSIIAPCKNNVSCIQKSLETAIPKILKGIPEIGVVSSDPQFIPFVDGNLSEMKYKLYNSSIFGLSECILSNLNVKDDITVIKFDMNCSELKMTGQYDLTGKLFSVPVEGNGDFKFVSRDYFLSFTLNLEKIEGKSYSPLKKMSVIAKPLTSATYDFKNLYNGQKDLADNLKKFVKQNWQKVAELVQEPIWAASMEIMTIGFNTYLEHDG